MLPGAHRHKCMQQDARSMRMKHYKVDSVSVKCIPTHWAVLMQKNNIGLHKHETFPPHISTRPYLTIIGTVTPKRRETCRHSSSSSSSSSSHARSVCTAGSWRVIHIKETQALVPNESVLTHRSQRWPCVTGHTHTHTLPAPAHELRSYAPTYVSFCGGVVGGS